jgi:hypothetical protein
VVVKTIQARKAGEKMRMMWKWTCIMGARIRPKRWKGSRTTGCFDAVLLLSSLLYQLGEALGPIDAAVGHSHSCGDPTTVGAKCGGAMRATARCADAAPRLLSNKVLLRLRRTASIKPVRANYRSV